MYTDYFEQLIKCSFVYEEFSINWNRIYALLQHVW